MFFSNECWPQLLAPLEIVMSKIFLKYIPIHIGIFYFLYAKKIKIKTRFYALIWMKTEDTADTEEQRMQFESSRYSPKCHYADTEETNCYFWFLSVQKVFSLL